ncbi:DUF885 domain-containing protein [Brevundimonas sanguinis]|uniref:DUF885 domain-containing protein n=1 Tax=Brevundimonas sanguinis TaxID=3021811 RepID=UPI0024151D14|nr:DUF885 family protein [Brevundimonas sp. NCCP 15609]
MIDARRINRRGVLAAGSGLALAAAAGPVWAGAKDADARLDAMLDAQLQAWLDRAPELVTGLGLDVGARAAQRFKLADRSQAAAVAGRDKAAADLAAVRAVDPASLSPEARLSRDIAVFQLECTAAYRAFPFHKSEGWREGPYIVSQIGGVYSMTPDFLDAQHPVKTAQDVDAALSRMAAFAKALDQDTDRAEANAAAGIVPPDFLLDGALAQLKALRDGQAKDKAMIRSLTRRAREQGLDDPEAAAVALFEGPIRQALTRQIAALERHRARAVHDAGIGSRLPDPEAYYALNLKTYTTTAYSADEIHRIGRDQVAELTGRLDGLLKAQGYTKGTVGERVAALNREPRFLFGNTDAGRAELLAYLETEMARVRARMPEVFATVPRGGFEIRRIPVEIEGGAPGGYASAGSLDGTRPGIYYINLKDTADWPRWSLKTLTYHEAAPGHLFQGALAREAGDLPLYRRLTGFSAYSEGWGLYAERLADEMGFYDDDPFGRIGYLQSFLFRAARLVVDTGLHAKGWSREEAIRYMIATAAEPENRAAREIERYCAAPGQACAYKLGEIEIARLRAEAERRPGFSLKTFHDRVVMSGPMPMTVLASHLTAST